MQFKCLDICPHRIRRALCPRGVFTVGVMQTSDATRGRTRGHQPERPGFRPARRPAHCRPAYRNPLHLSVLSILIAHESLSHVNRKQVYVTSLFKTLFSKEWEMYLLLNYNRDRLNCWDPRPGDAARSHARAGARVSPAAPGPPFPQPPRSPLYTGLGEEKPL